MWRQVGEEGVFPRRMWKETPAHPTSAKPAAVGWKGGYLTL